MCKRTYTESKALPRVDVLVQDPESHSFKVTRDRDNISCRLGWAGCRCMKGKKSFLAASQLCPDAIVGKISGWATLQKYGFPMTLATLCLAYFAFRPRQEIKKLSAYNT